MVDEQEWCRNHHIRSPENTVWEKGSNGRMRRRCRICRQNSRAARMKNRTGIDAIPLQPIRLYSELSREELKITQEFRAAQDLVDAKCRNNPGPYADYDEDHIPSPEYATELCADCPLAALCTRDAKVLRPGWGVQGSEVYVYGSVYLEGTYNGEEGNDNSDSSD